MPFPDIDPILFQIGPIAIRWYSLAYVAGLFIGWRYIRCMVVKLNYRIDVQDIDDFLTWAVLGVIAGGRIGYILFYNPAYYFSHPLDALKVWHGGMSFHGGLLGVIVVTYIFAKRRGIDVLSLGDLVATAAPLGLLFGRVANFINGELFGRPTDVAWGIIFPSGGPVPRHPSQLYEAALEGLFLLLLLNLLVRFEAVRERKGLLMGVFLTGYSLSRSFVELFREPDVQIGFLTGGTTMGQWLSMPMLLIGAALIFWTLVPDREVRQQGGRDV